MILKAPVTVYFADIGGGSPYSIELPTSSSTRTIAMRTFGAPYFVGFSIADSVPEPLFRCNGLQVFEVPPFIRYLWVEVPGSDWFYYYFA